MREVTRTVLPHVVLRTEVSHEVAVRHLGPAGWERTVDWSVLTAGLVGGHHPADSPHPAAQLLVRTGHLTVLTLGLVLGQPGPHQLHLAALLAVLAGDGHLVQQPLREVQPGAGLECPATLRTGANLGATGTADDMTLGNSIVVSESVWFLRGLTLSHW